jgi:formamidopyrimidine-DNA glycosylase
MRFTGMFSFTNAFNQNWMLMESDAPYSSNTIRAVLNMADGEVVNFHDSRCLSLLYYYPAQHFTTPHHLLELVMKEPLLSKQAPDWLITDRSASLHELNAGQSEIPELPPCFPAISSGASSRGNNLRVLLKDYLLSQEEWGAGVGNYIVCEVMYRTGFHPLTCIGNITKEEDWKLIHSTVLEVMRRAIEVNADYTAPNYIKVFSRQISEEGNPVRRIAQGNRGTYYCPLTQVKFGSNTLIGTPEVIEPMKKFTNPWNLLPPDTALVLPASEQDLADQFKQVYSKKCHRIYLLDDPFAADFGLKVEFPDG